MLKVSEMFYSLQGEGLHAGVPMAFVRLQGCNFLSGQGCRWCDTLYAQDGNAGTSMLAEAVVEEIVKISPWLKSWICVTGGEPLFQHDDLYKLLRGLKRQQFKIEVETNGSINPPDWYTLVDSWVADIKCPSSGICGTSSLKWFDCRNIDQIKLVVATEEDLDFARTVIKSHLTAKPQVLISPVVPTSGAVNISEWFQEVANFCKEERVRLSLQVHKMIWGNKDGV